MSRCGARAAWTRCAARLARVLPPLLGLILACTPRGGRPDILLVVVDTLRADRPGCYGGSVPTPRIDALAAHGVRAANAFSHVPITLPSFSTLLTSTLPPTTGVHDNEGFRLDSSARTLAEILGDAGYFTAAVVGAVVLDASAGLAQGFDRYDDDFSGRYVAYQAGLRSQEALFQHTQRRADAVTDRALAIADSMPGDRPFFLLAHYYDPHVPYDPPPPDDEAAGASGLYDGEIAFTDREIGRLLDGLDARGRLANALIVLTADHGEALGGHGERTHAFLAYDQTLHVPLIFSRPGSLPEGRVYDGLARLIDVAPTILEIAGVPRPAGDAMQGRSLLPFESGGAGFSYFETAMPFLVFGYSGLRGVRSREWKYIDAPRPELYRVSKDPAEEWNLASRAPDVADSLRGVMHRIVAGIPLFRGEAGEMSAATDAEGREARRERLLALGYIGTSGTLDTGFEAMFDPSLDDPKDRVVDFGRLQALRGQINAARLFVDTGRYDEALRLLDTLPEQGEGAWRVHLYRGRALQGLGQRERAGEELRAALEAAPGGPERVEVRTALRSFRDRF